MKLCLLQSLTLGDLGPQRRGPPLHRFLQILVCLSEQSLRLGQ
jgi:hypothetical protein